MIILGIDPGLNATGYGLIEADGRQLRLIVAGDIRPPRGRALPERLEVLHHELAAIITAHTPDVAALEMIYTHHAHITTAARMGHARGVACLAAEQHGVRVVEYSPNRVKKALTGHGTASKTQVAQMVEQWMGRQSADWSFDATDALALAIAHAHMDQPERRAADLLPRRRRLARTAP